MDIAVWITFVIGIAAGGSIIYIRQRKVRMEELEKAAAMTEDIRGGDDGGYSGRPQAPCLCSGR